MIDWTGLISIFVAFVVVAASPGPATLAVSTVSAAHGRKSGMIFGAGLAVGLAVWGLVAATGLGAVIQTSARILIALKVAGGIYLLWMAYRSACSAIRVASKERGVDGHEPCRESRLFAKGLALNLSNPKAVVAWMAALSVGLGADDGFGSVVLATLGCALIGTLIYATYATAFSLPAIMKGYVKFRNWVDGVVSALFAIAGIALIRSAFSRS